MAKDFSPIEVQKSLHGASYPTKSKDLADLARRNGASSKLADKIEKGADHYDGPNDVQKAVFRHK